MRHSHFLVWLGITSLAACGGNVALGGHQGDGGSEDGAADASPSSSSSGSGSSSGGVTDATVDGAGPDGEVRDGSPGDASSVDASTCPLGETRCNGTCVNTSADDSNCGACGSICSGQCTYGHCIVTVASGQTGAYALALDATNVYWSIAAGNVNDAVMTVPKSGGTPVTLVSNQINPLALAVDATGIYWTSGSQSSNTVAVMHAGLDGSNPTTLASGQNTANIAIDSTSVYWTENSSSGGNPVGSVFSVAKTGGTPVQLASAQGSAMRLAVAGPGVYWADLLANSSGDILMTDGGAATLVSSFSHSPNGGVVTDASYVYWANEDGTILKVPLLGGTPTTLATSLNQPQGLALDGSDLYCAVSGDNGSNGSIVRVSAMGGGSVVLTAGGAPQAIAVDAVNIYWTDEGSAGSAVLRMPK